MGIKKIIFLTLFIGLFGFTLGKAYGYSCDTCSQDCSRLCCACDNYAFLRPAQPLTKCSYFLGAEFLYWGARENNLDFAQTDVNAPVLSDMIRGKLIYVQYDWHPGVRVWGGYRWGCDDWESSIVYTYFKTRGSEEVSQGGGIALGPILANATVARTVFGPSAIEAEAKIRLKYQTLDLLLSRHSCVSKTFILKPLFGFRALWLDRHLTANYSGAPGDGDSVSVIWDSDLSGYGFHGGVDGDLRLCSLFDCGLFSLRGHLGGTIVAAHPDVRNIQQTILDGDLQQEPINTKDKGNFIGVTGLHLSGGISWENCFKCFYLLFNLGYEFNQYFNLPQVRRYNIDSAIPVGLAAYADLSNNGNLLVHGLTLSAEISF